MTPQLLCVCFCQTLSKVPFSENATNCYNSFRFNINITPFTIHKMKSIFRYFHCTMSGKICKLYKKGGNISESENVHRMEEILWILLH